MENTVTLKHDLSFMTSSKKKHPTGNREQNAVEEPAIDQVLKRLEYFSIPASTTVINSTLASFFNNAGAEEAKLYHQMKQSRRLQSEFHVTLIHRASSSVEPDMWSKYTNEYMQALTRTREGENKQKEPNLGAARIRLERLVWDDRVMAFVVRILPSNGHQGADGEASCWPCANATPHITVGTASSAIKAKVSNDLLRRWLEGDESHGKIWEKEVPEMKILEGTARAVMQKR